MYCYRRWSHKLRAKNGEMGTTTLGWVMVVTTTVGWVMVFTSLVVEKVMFL